MFHPREYLKIQQSTAHEFQVRPYRPSDLTDVELVEVKSFGDDRYPNFLFTQFGDILGAGFLVACQSEALVGYVLAVEDSSRPHRGWIFSLAVQPEHRLSGAATQLMGEAESHLTARGCTEVALTVDPRNEPARSLYLSRGYHQVAYLPHHFGEGEHRLMLVCPLPRPTVK